MWRPLAPGKISDEKIAELVVEHFDLRPGAIIRDLDLRRPIYRQVAAYGHFGRDDLDLPWDRFEMKCRESTWRVCALRPKGRVHALLLFSSMAVERAAEKIPEYLRKASHFTTNSVLVLLTR
jgi:hypothetical protein